MGSERIPSGERRIAHDHANLFQGEIKLPEKQDLLQAQKLRVVIEPVACRRAGRTSAHLAAIRILAGPTARIQNRVTCPGLPGSAMYTRRYALYGALFGVAFPLIGTLVEAASRGYGLGLDGLFRAQSSPLLWIVDTAPFFLGVMASFAGRRQDQIIAIEAARRG